MTTASTGYAPYAHWMRFRDSRVNDLLQIADYFDTFVNDEDVAEMRREVRELTHVPIEPWLAAEPALTDAGIDVLLGELRERIDQAQRIEDGDLDAGAGFHDLDIAIEHLRDEAASIAEHVLTIKGHRHYGLIVERVAA